jgi:hypothetical protein
MTDNSMYPETKTWNPYVGCKFDCTYCEKSFKRQLKRVGGNPQVRQGSTEKNGEIGEKGGCTLCSSYEPHYHSERLESIPTKSTVFVCGTGYIAFCEPEYTRRILEAIKDNQSRKEITYYFQSKNPAYFEQFLGEYPENAVLLTTLETNRDGLGQSVSKAPMPSTRWRDFMALEYPRKAVTIEPVLDFDLDEFTSWMTQLHGQGSLEYVWFGYDSKSCGLDEPSIELSQRFVDGLKNNGIEVRGKKMNGVII